MATINSSNNNNNNNNNNVSTKKSSGIKSILLKLLQVLLFTTSIMIYLEIIGNKDNLIDESKLEKAERKRLDFYKWFAGIILFAVAWSIGTFKVLSKLLLAFFVTCSIQQFIQHLPLQYYQEAKNIALSLLRDRVDGEVFNEYISVVLPFNGENFNKELVLVQCGLILFFSFLGFNIHLADKFWLLKTIIIDWVLALILMVMFSISDLLNKQTRVFLVLSYIFGSNIIGFGTIKLLEYFWNLSSKLDSTIMKSSPSSTNSNKNTSNNNKSTLNNKSSNNSNNKIIKKLDDSIDYDTDSNFTPNSNEPIYNLEEQEEEEHVEKVLVEENGELVEEEVKVDNLDYNKLTESELDAILSEPIQESQVSTRNLAYHKSTKFINNLIAPDNINQRISAKEFVGVIILWVYAMSNIIIENYSYYTIANILVFIGFSGTILSYLSTISAKRLTNKNPSKREC